MSAWLWQSRPLGNWYLSTNASGVRSFQNLKTKDHSEAQQILVQVRAEQSGRPFANGNLHWSKADYEKFTNFRGRSRVSKQSYACATNAMQLLSDEKRFGFLLKPIPRITTLAQLGRIQSAEIMRLAADEICERKMPSKAAIAFLRQLRNVHRAARPSTLADGIRRAIKHHCAVHPETSAKEIAIALRDLASEFDATLVNAVVILK
jgi:hypothetical protein